VKTLNAVTGVVAALVLLASIPLVAAIQLAPVASGLSSPLFVTHAGDGSNRLFVVERDGVIKVLQPGSSTPSVFLDITSRVVSGGEQGLLGLAFHPSHSINGRFFIYYTRAAGEIVIAEYNLTSNRDVASTAEAIVLTIPHPGNTNHNGGMLTFGADGFLYAGVGDGGGANDVPNNAQDLDTLLGKILRIDINTPANSGLPYVSPADNPFVGMGGRDEIFAYGMRNPWRFSFDRGTHQLWVADVGQGAREEVDTPIVSGGNYGWRIFEGFSCTGNDPALCTPANYIPPVFEYTHANGRCSITGGYVYRGSQNAVASGTYLYGDYCSGEILGWDGAGQNLLLDTALNISSFGEDEAGEVYVVGLGGTVSRIVSTTPPPPPPPPPPQCTYAISPTRANFTRTGGPGSVAVTTQTGCPWTAVSNDSWISVTGGSNGSGSGAVTYSVAPYAGRQGTRNGRITVGGLTFTVKQSK
jgi:glucose/arabinose dehydrogenase